MMRGGSPNGSPPADCYSDARFGMRWMVQFHQSHAYEDFVEGWRPTETGGFALRNGVFFEFCKRAEARPDTRFVFIIDEINRGSLSRILGELLMLIERDKRGSAQAIPLTYSGAEERFFVPDNVHALGMMNTADRSLAMVDYARCAGGSPTAKRWRATAAPGRLRSDHLYQLLAYLRNREATEPGPRHEGVLLYPWSGSGWR